MAIDFTFPPEVEEVRLRVRAFMANEVKPAETDSLWEEGNRRKLVETIIALRKKAQDAGLWLPHMPPEWGGMGLGPTALAAVSSECARTRLGSFILNCQAPDEGNMHTLEHFGTREQKEKYLRPLCQGIQRSCFAMTEPEVAGSDPTLIQTSAVLDGDHWVVNGHKWFITGAHGATFAILIARTNADAEIPQERNTAFIVETNLPGWTVVRDIETMAGGHNHCEIRIENLRLPKDAVLGRIGGGHELGQVRLGPARLAHCMRWLGQIEVALEMMIDRAQKRFSHGTMLSEKQGIQWLIADSGMELYAAKLMVLHAAYKIENKLPYKTEVSYCKHHVANTLWRVIDRAVQVHGALGYSKDTPLSGMLSQARWARFADGADEIHQMRIAQMLMQAYSESGSTRRATGDLPL
ncbi:MAG TPA: acyl-CoA dehydrogenase family protein [Polyangiales bacterium]|nr:acyl-CoA dehydrogenase family protein [Polyangiales bacterium]